MGTRMLPVSTLRVSENGDTYCSQRRTLLPPIRTIEEGVGVIEQILSKGLICRHDVQDLNHAYEATNLLERLVEKIPERNTQYVLKQLLEKIEIITRNSTVSAEHLISLYHLQKFSIEGERFHACFRSLYDRFEKRGEKFQEVAADLPCCISEAHFSQDAAVLIGQNRTPEINKTLNTKRAELQNYERAKQAREEKRLDLASRRKKDPQQHPAYFDELLDKGYIHFYDHLIKMRDLPSRQERKAAIEQMTFSDIAHVVLEVRDAIIQKVVSALPADRGFRDGKCKILFLLGNSGAGKSTALCFLRGDKMILKGSRYESQSDKSELIGHDLATSCTLLPTIEITHDWIIVDFLGFDDTNGQLISLGMEFALKRLIEIYHPQIMVLESIRNDEGRYAAAAKLGLRIRRLLKICEKEDCVLGITKYAQDPDFVKLKAIEEQQKKERLDQTSEETKLIAKIEVYSSLRQPGSEPSLEEQKMQRKLEEIQRKREEEARQPLQDTPEKIEHRKRVQERENELSKQVGLNKYIIRFCDLESPNHLSSCLDALAKFPFGLITYGPFRDSSFPILDADDERLLQERFTNNLKKELETSKNYIIECKDVKDLEQRVLESSLISTIFSQSNPEIGLFLHLQEMDPDITRKYDREIVSDCIKKYIDSVINALNLSLFDKVLKEAQEKVPQAKVTELNERLTRLRDYIMGLLGVVPKEDPERTRKEWDRIRKEHQVALDGVEQGLQLPAWLKAWFSFLFERPSGILSLLNWIGQNESSPNTIERMIDTCCNNLTQIHEALQKLKDIEKTIQKLDDFNQAFRSLAISAKSIRSLHFSIQSRINKLRNIYGGEDWDRRVSFLADSFLAGRLLDHKNPTHISYVMAFAGTLIEPDLHNTLQTQAMMRKRDSDPVGFDELSHFISFSYFVYRKDKSKHQIKLELEELNPPKIQTLIPRRLPKLVDIDSMTEFAAQVSEFYQKNLRDSASPLFRTMVAAAILKHFPISESYSSCFLD